MTSILLFILIAQCDARSQSLGEEVLQLERYRKGIEQGVSITDTAFVSIQGRSTEGGEATAFLNKQGIHRIKATFFGEMGKSEWDMFFAEAGLFLVERRQFQYNRPISMDPAVVSPDDTVTFDHSKTIETVDRFYFNGNELILVEDRAEPWSNRLIEQGGDIRELATDLHGLLIAAPRTPIRRRPWQKVDLSSCIMAHPDTSISGIGLANRVSTTEVLGDPDRFEYYEDEEDMPYIRLNSQGGGEVLTLFFHYGGIKGGFNEMRISEDEGQSIHGTVPVDRFITGNGIHLGMLEDEVLQRLGPCLRRGIGAKGSSVLFLDMRDLEASGFLQGYNMPAYYAALDLKDGVLVSYRFGFEYP